MEAIAGENEDMKGLMLYITCKDEWNVNATVILITGNSEQHLTEPSFANTLPRVHNRKR